MNDRSSPKALPSYTNDICLICKKTGEKLVDESDNKQSLIVGKITLRDRQLIDGSTVLVPQKYMYKTCPVHYALDPMDTEKMMAFTSEIVALAQIERDSVVK